MNPSDDDLAKLLADTESQLVERKPSATDGQGIRRNICAFANDLPHYQRPGVVFIGVEDDGTPHGLTIDDRLQQVLSNMRSDGNILPPPSLSIEKRKLCGHDVAVIFVAPSPSPPVRFESRVYVKVGPTTRHATEDEEKQLAERRRAADLPFDMLPEDAAGIDDLDIDYVRTQYLPRAVAVDVPRRITARCPSSCARCA